MTLSSMTTVDAEVERAGLEGPFMLKLDTHGFEAPILAGAASTIRETSIAVVEAYNFEMQPGAMRFHQLCRGGPRSSSDRRR